MQYNRIRKLPLTENGKNAWQNSVATIINANNIIAGDNIGIEYGPNGATISVDSVDDTPTYQYMGDFDSASAYYPNQIVRVRPDTIYYDINGNPIDLGSTADSGYETFPISPGLYICTAYVPPFHCDETWFNTIIAPLYPDNSTPLTYVQGTRWDSYNIYYPMYPEIPLQYTASVIVGGSYNIVANQSFWNALPIGMREMKSCAQTIYVMAYVSGSSFQTEYLPYPI